MAEWVISDSYMWFWFTGSRGAVAFFNFAMWPVLQQIWCDIGKYKYSVVGVWPPKT